MSHAAAPALAAAPAPDDRQCIGRMRFAVSRGAS
jgi:hypothetical protein